MKKSTLVGCMLAGAATMAASGLPERYFGTNYTLPFAHGYRAAGILGQDRKAAIDQDVYHMARLGLNGFRIHLWDAELADSVGNLLDNDHLDLLDYLINRLEERGISVILTAQTNFGNGYPEHDTDTGAFTYDYAKCDIHADPEAIKAQERYLEQLSRHTNPYNGRRYADDPGILAMEINNEPCHTTSPEQVKEYINRMVKALRGAGWKKPTLYNASHNGDMTHAYFDSDADGTTYQWYPVGLVSGRARTGNYLPYVDIYKIPFDTIAGFDSKFKVIYEFDPADMPGSYMFPAIARTFASEGFQWATQFAYDPLFLAPYNTEYQTHYLNLAYSPGKAIGMMVAAEAMRQVPEGADYGKYPADTVFGDFTVSFIRDLAALNSEEKFLYTNSNDLIPAAPDRLRQVAGRGSSAIVRYDGLGAYFLDEAAPGVWRLEVMPDPLFSADPFGKPSLGRPMAWVLFPEGGREMTISLPGLGNGFTAVRADNPADIRQAREGMITIQPGVYFLAADKSRLDLSALPERVGTIGMREFVMPVNPSEVPLHVNHRPVAPAVKGSDIAIEAQAFAGARVDSVVIYPASASFWRRDNRLYRADSVAPYLYKATVPAADIAGRDSFDYRIVAWADGKARVFPQDAEGTPLDWDAPDNTPFYSVPILPPGEPLVLLDASGGTDGAELSTIPDSWGRAWLTHRREAPVGTNAIELAAKPDGDLRAILTKELPHYPAALTDGKKTLRLRLADRDGVSSIQVMLADIDGITFGTTVEPAADSVADIPLDSLTVVPTLLVPAPYPTFLSREFMPEGDFTLDPSRLGRLQIAVPFNHNGGRVSIVGAWLE